MTFSLLFFMSFLLFSQSKFTFRDDHTFTIMQVTDMHYGESIDLNIGNNKNLLSYIEQIHPDLVVITGDLVTGYVWNMEDQSFFEDIWRNFSQIFQETQTYFAYTLGNHDQEANLDRKQIVKLAMETPYSLMNSSEEIDWVSMYNIPIYSKFNDSALATNLWLFDSGDQYLFHLSWGKISEEQIQYFKRKNAELRTLYKNIPHSIAFFHIPIPEFKDLWNYYKVYGEKNEKVCCPLFNHGVVFNEFVKENVSGVFCGHDHFNYYGGWMEKVELVYGRKTGLGGEGPPKNVTRGVRVINLKEKFNESTKEITIERDHYILDEEGDIILNEPAFARSYGYQYICNPSFDFSVYIPIFEHFTLILFLTFVYLLLRIGKGYF